MPTYRYHCQGCSAEFEYWQSIHAESLTVHNDSWMDHDELCHGPLVKVFTNVRTYGVGPRGFATRSFDETERQWDKDRPAYKRLRRAGHQPPNVDGADRLEALAENHFEVDSGLRYGKLPVDRVEEGIGRARESGWKPGG